MAVTTPATSIAGRQLTSREIALAKQVFGDSIIYAQLRLNDQQWPGSLSADFSQGTANLRTIFMVKMAQLWQEQNLQSGLPSAAAAQIWDTLSRWLGDTPRAGFNFNLDPAKKFGSYTAEQQADIAVDYYRLYWKKHGRGTLPKDEMLALYEHLMAESHHGHGHEAHFGQGAVADVHELTHQLHDEDVKASTPGIAATALGPSVLALGSANTLGSGLVSAGHSVNALGSANSLGSGIVASGIVATDLNKTNTPKDAFPLAELPAAEKRTYLPKDIWRENEFIPIEGDKGRWLIVKDSYGKDQSVLMHSANSVVAINSEDKRNPVDVAQQIYLKMAQEQLKATPLIPRSHSAEPGLSSDR